MTRHTEEGVEDALVAAGANAPRLTPTNIDAKIVSEEYHHFPGTTLIVCALKLVNGFIVTGTSAATSPENFSEVIGQHIAKSNARSRIWELEDYLLRQRLYEGRPVR